LTLDLLLMCFVGGLALWGWIRGALRQVAQLLAMVLAAFLARPLTPFIAPHLGELPIARETAAPMLCFIGVLLVSGVALHFVLRKLFIGDDLQRTKLDRAAGLVLGGAKGFLLSLVGLSLLRLFAEDPAVPSGPVAAVTSTSRAFAAAQPLNLPEADPSAVILTQLTAASVLPGATPSEGTSQPSANPILAMLKDNPKYREILKRPSLKAVVERGNPQEILKVLLEETHKDRERDAERASREN
jgi:hypothetical protein